MPTQDGVQMCGRNGWERRGGGHSSPRARDGRGMGEEEEASLLFPDESSLRIPFPPFFPFPPFWKIGAAGGKEKKERGRLSLQTERKWMKSGQGETRGEEKGRCCQEDREKEGGRGRGDRNLPCMAWHGSTLFLNMKAVA